MKKFTSRMHHIWVCNNSTVPIMAYIVPFSALQAEHRTLDKLIRGGGSLDVASHSAGINGEAKVEEKLEESRRDGLLETNVIHPGSTMMCYLGGAKVEGAYVTLVKVGDKTQLWCKDKKVKRGYQLTCGGDPIYVDNFLITWP